MDYVSNDDTLPTEPKILTNEFKVNKTLRLHVEGLRSLEKVLNFFDLSYDGKSRGLYRYWLKFVVSVSDPPRYKRIRTKNGNR